MTVAGAPRTPTRAFFERDAVEVAPQLLGAILSHRTPEGIVAVRITEVEAYRGAGEDPGSHAHRGPTPRTRVMFAEPGRLYAYFSYGMHVCANIVCSPAGAASAVLLRGGEVVGGLELARMRRRPTASVDRDLARGPARLAMALGIGLGDGGSDILSEPFRLAVSGDAEIFASGPRTGVSGAGGSAGFPWRFWLPGEPTVSPYRRHAKSHE
ncbi:DNA-3-methyladenine glycosylase [Luethyella okanaganae]|uniref:Putative 3-methyladenine DNA glycosylase n=1 Tax=Luethyella okanaganae TaxID=69372 RepID=A0ABW1VKD5_9MICO